MRSDELAALRELSHNIVMQVNQIPEKTRQALTDHQWSTIPLYVSEKAFNAALGVGVPMIVPPITSGLEVITSVVASVPTGATGLITLGDLQLPIPAGLSIITSVQFTLLSADVRSLVLAGGGGAAALWLTGQCLPTYGVLPS